MNAGQSVAPLATGKVAQVFSVSVSWIVRSPVAGSTDWLNVSGVRPEAAPLVRYAASVT